MHNTTIKRVLEQYGEVKTQQSGDAIFATDFYLRVLDMTVGWTVYPRTRNVIRIFIGNRSLEGGATLKGLLDAMSRHWFRLDVGLGYWKTWLRLTFGTKGYEGAEVTFGPMADLSPFQVPVGWDDLDAVIGMFEAEAGAQLIDWLSDKDPFAGDLIHRLRGRAAELGSLGKTH